MIDRYTRPEMGHIFSLENKYAIWQEIEVLACEAQAELGKIGISKDEAQWIRDHANFEKAKVDEIEEVTRHDVIAFLTNMKEYIDADVPEGDPKPSRWVHYGMTSSDLGDTALCYQLTQACDLIISDALMPEMDGFELCRRVKSDLQYSHIPVLLLTAKTDVASKVEGLGTGADIYVEKPFSLEYLRASISALLSNRELVRRHFLESPFAKSETLTYSKADENFMCKLDQYIMQHLEQAELSVEEMAEEMCMSSSKLLRKLKAIIGMNTCASNG